MARHTAKSHKIRKVEILVIQIVIKMSFHTHFLHLEILYDKMYVNIHSLESQVQKCVF